MKKMDETSTTKKLTRFGDLTWPVKTGIVVSWIVGLLWVLVIILTLAGG
jgi:hypothetical protein